VPPGEKKALATVSPVPAACVTSAEVAKILGVTRNAVRKLADGGKLNATRDEEGRRLFDRAEVLDLARLRGATRGERLQGSVAAAVFELFEQGLPLPAIVQRTHQSPLVIRALWAEYHRPLGKRAELTATGAQAVAEAVDRLDATIAREGLTGDERARKQR
jgi:excisionase family DNA binding protein